MVDDGDHSECVGFGFLCLGRSGLPFGARIRLNAAETGHGRVAVEVGNLLGGHLLHRHRGKVRGPRAVKGETELWMT